MMTKYDQSCTVTFPAAQEKTHVVCTASSVSYVTFYCAVYMLQFDSYCVMHAAVNLVKKFTRGFEHLATLELQRHLLASKCCMACSALLCCAGGLLVSTQSKLLFSGTGNDSSPLCLQQWAPAVGAVSAAS